MLFWVRLCDKVLLSPQSLGGGYQGSERLSNFFKVTQPGSSRARLQILRPTLLNAALDSGQIDSLYGGKAQAQKTMDSRPAFPAFCPLVFLEVFLANSLPSSHVPPPQSHPGPPLFLHTSYGPAVFCNL